MMRFEVLAMIFIMFEYTQASFQSSVSRPQYWSNPLPSSSMISVVKDPSCLVRSLRITVS